MILKLTMLDGTTRILTAVKTCTARGTTCEVVLQCQDSQRSYEDVKRVELLYDGRAPQ